MRECAPDGTRAWLKAHVVAPAELDDGIVRHTQIDAGR